MIFESMDYIQTRTVFLDDAVNPPVTGLPGCQWALRL
jgi:hypothetical protein